jgi:Zn-dependent peptidase ImmA (M78 family)
MRARKLDVVGTIYRVVFTNETACEDLKDRYGYTDLDAKVIYIRETDSPEVQQDTLVHEVGHALFEEMGIKPFLALTLPAKTNKVDWEESFISTISPRIVQLIKSNKRKLWIL